MSSQLPLPPAKSLSLSELIALNQELAALVRAGIPLEQGLIELGSSNSGTLGEVAGYLGNRLQAGETLSRILGDDSVPLPRFWKATILAGIRAGRLGSVLEHIVTSGRRLAESRRTLCAALLYPLIVMVLAYVVFVFAVTYLAPVFASALKDLTAASEPFVDLLAWLGGRVWWWVFVIPGLALVCLAVEWFAGRRDPLVGGSPLVHRLMSCWPSWRRSRRDSQFAAFAEILSLLIREQTPLPEALLLAAEASSDDLLRASATRLSGQLGSGQKLSAEQVRSLNMPPLLGFMLATGANRVELSDALSVAADRYRERSAATANRNAVLVPIVFSAVVGGAAALALGMTVFGPICILLWRLGSST